jgi:hypothetical protein
MKYHGKYILEKNRKSGESKKTELRRPRFFPHAVPPRRSSSYAINDRQQSINQRQEASAHLGR